MSFLLLLLVVALAASAAASTPSSPGSQALPDSPQPELIIRFPHNREVPCWRGACPPGKAGCLDLRLEGVLGAYPECRFLSDDMSLSRRSQLLLMFRDMVRPGQRLKCTARVWDPEDLRSAEFEVVSGRDRHICRAAADAGGRDSAAGLVALADSATTSAPTSPGSQALPDRPQPALIIRFPHNREVACWYGECPLAVRKCFDFYLDRVLDADYKCRLLPDDMDRYRRAMLLVKFLKMERPGRRLHCDGRGGMWDPEELRSAEFEMVSGRDRRLCRRAADAGGRDSAAGLGRPLQPKSPFDMSESDSLKRLLDSLRQLHGPYHTSVHERLPDDISRPIDWSDINLPEKRPRIKIKKPLPRPVRIKLPRLLKNPWSQRPVRIRPPPLPTGPRLIGGRG